MSPRRIAAFGSLLAFGCGAGGGALDERVEGEVGHLALGLEIGAGGAYRLEAEYRVYDTEGVGLALQEEDDGTLNAALPPGPYEILLAPGWRVLRSHEPGEFPIDAVLVSPNPMAVEILPRTAVSVMFEFAVPRSPAQDPSPATPLLVDEPAPCEAGPLELPTTQYADADGDGFGNPAVTRVSCSLDDGWVLDATDCDDHDPRVYPGQLEPFATPSASGSFDYDCDGEASPSPSATLACGPLGIACTSGFREAAPSCGEVGVWADCGLVFLCLDRPVTVACR